MVGGFLKTGKAARQALEDEDRRTEALRATSGKPLRFYLPKDKESRITFLDGDLDEDGMLSCPAVHEHNLQLNGSWKNWFICIGDEEPCPLCDSGHKPYLAFLFTVIDHSEFVDKENKKRSNEIRMFVAKRTTFKQLQKIALKRGGLAGCTFDVARVGNEAPNVGDMFDFLEKNDVDKLKKFYDVDVLNYEESLTYKTAAELREMGFGSKVMGGGPSDDDDDEGGPAFDQSKLDSAL